MEKKKIRVSAIVCTIIVLIVILLALFPLVWMFVSSFKMKTEVFAIPIKFLPKKWNTINYTNIFEKDGGAFVRSMFVTFFVSGISVVLSLFLNTMAGYVFARMRFYGKKLFWAYCIFTMYIPGMTIMLTSFLVVNSLKMLNTLPVLILPGLISGYNIFFFRQFFLNIPNSLEEAALIDGCGRFRIFTSIFLPISKAPMVVLGAGVFIGYWNSFLWPSLTISQTAYMQVMQIVRSFRSVYASDYGAVMAATCIAIIPPVLLFFAFQKYIVKGVILSGLK